MIPLTFSDRHHCQLRHTLQVLPLLLRSLLPFQHEVQELDGLGRVWICLNAGKLLSGQPTSMTVPVTAVKVVSGRRWWWVRLPSYLWSWYKSWVWKLERCKPCSSRKDILNLKARPGRLMASFSMSMPCRHQNWFILSKASKNSTTSRLLYQTKRFQRVRMPFSAQALWQTA